MRDIIFFIVTSSETKDFLVVELVDGRLKISVNQGDTYRNFVSTVNTKNKLNDGVFHKVVIYKREKVDRLCCYKILPMIRTQ